MPSTPRIRVSLSAAVIATLGISAVLSLKASAQEPATVPDVVKILRPTTADIEIARRALEQFASDADEDVQSVLNRFPKLLEVRVPPPNSAIVPSLARFFQAKHQANLEVAKKGTANVLFLGDSITDFWRNSTGNFAGKPVLDEHFGHLDVANFGIAGDTTQGVLYRLQNGEGAGFKPRAVMLMIGTNNIRRNTAPEIAEGIGAVVLELQSHFPDAKILLLGIFPRGRTNDSAREIIAEINRSISALHDGGQVTYLDIGEKFLDEDGNIPSDVMSDGLHPTTKGYEIWAEAVKEKLGVLMDLEQVPVLK